MNYWTAVFAVFVAALLLGCGGQAPPAAEPQAQQPATTTPATTAPATTAPSEPAVTEPSSAPLAPSAQGASFESLLAKAEGAQYKADYATTVKAEGQTSTYKSTVVFKGKNMRTDVTAEGTKVSTYLLDKKAYMCTYADTVMCLASDVPADDLAEKVENAPSDYQITPKLPRTVAGILASCFGMTGADIRGEYEACYSADGIPLYIAASDGSFVQSATKVQVGNVADSEFVLPAEPIDMSAYAGYTG